MGTPKVCVHEHREENSSGVEIFMFFHSNYIFSDILKISVKVRSIIISTQKERIFLELEYYNIAKYMISMGRVFDLKK